MEITKESLEEAAREYMRVRGIGADLPAETLRKVLPSLMAGFAATLLVDELREIFVPETVDG